MGSPERKDLLRPLQSRPKTPGKKETRERVRHTTSTAVAG